MAKSAGYDWKEEDKPAKKKLHHLEVSRGKNRGFIVTHHFQTGGMHFHEPEDHVFGESEGQDMLDHVAKHMQVEHPGEEGE